MNNTTNADLKKIFTEGFQKLNDKLDTLASTFVKESGYTRRGFSNLEERLTERNSDVFTKMDAVYKEILAMRQEQTIHSQLHSEIEDRLSLLESHSTVSHRIKK